MLDAATISCEKLALARPVWELMLSEHIASWFTELWSSNNPNLGVIIKLTLLWQSELWSSNQLSMHAIAGCFLLCSRPCLVVPIRGNGKEYLEQVEDASLCFFI